MALCCQAAVGSRLTTSARRSILRGGVLEEIPEGQAETIGQRLRRLRLERGLSQRELSERGVSYAYISRIEAGARRPSVKALRVTSPRPARPICAGRSS